jgi:hypothetical protein
MTSEEAAHRFIAELTAASNRRDDLKKERRAKIKQARARLARDGIKLAPRRVVFGADRPVK